MDVQLNYWGIVLAAISSMVVGTIWYGRSFWTGKEWMRLTKDYKKVDRSLNASLIVAVLMSLLLAYALAHITYISYKFFGGSYFSNAVSTAFWLWLGVAFSRGLVMDTFEGRPYKLTAINTGNSLVTMLVMGLILGWAGI
jgi:hypothetical protein